MGTCHRPSDRELAVHEDPHVVVTSEREVGVGGAVLQPIADLAGEMEIVPASRLFAVPSAK